MTPADRLKVPTHVIAKSVGSETVLLDLEQGTYFGLNALGARIVTLLEEGKCFEAIRDTLLDEYDVEPEVLMADISAFIDELTAKNLLEPY